MSEDTRRAERRNELTEVRFEKKGAIASIAPKDMRDALDFAKAMSSAGDMMPKHLQGNEGACLAVAMDSWNWGMNPFSVAKESYKVGTVIAYQAKVLAAAVNANANIKGRLDYTYAGDVRDKTRQCTAFAIDGQDGRRREYTTPTLSEIKVQNSPLWKNDPDQQLAYYAARGFARRHYQDVLMGVISVDEAQAMRAEEAKDITPDDDPELAAALSAVDDAEIIPPDAAADLARQAAQIARLDGAPKSPAEAYRYGEHDALNGVAFDPGLFSDTDMQQAYELGHRAGQSA